MSCCINNYIFVLMFCWLVGKYKMIYRKASLGIHTQSQAEPLILLKDLLHTFECTANWFGCTNNHREWLSILLHGDSLLVFGLWTQKDFLCGTKPLSPAVTTSAFSLLQLLSETNSTSFIIEHPGISPYDFRSRLIVFWHKWISEWIPTGNWWFCMSNVRERVA